MRVGLSYDLLRLSSCSGDLCCKVQVTAQNAHPPSSTLFQSPLNILPQFNILSPKKYPKTTDLVGLQSLLVLALKSAKLQQV